jgi:hypothetical protein
LPAGLLRAVRFVWMDGLYLANKARGALPPGCGLEELVLEAGERLGPALSLPYVYTYR